MTDFVTLTCLSCGGKLQVTNDIERFACSYCGTEHVVRRSGGLVSLAPVIESLGKVQTGVDKTASELAIRRLREDIKGLKSKLERIELQQGNKTASGIFIAFLGVVSLFVQYLVQYLFSGLGFLVFGLLCIAIGVWMAVSGRKKSDEERKLAQAIKEKQSQLNQHESIVGQ